MAGPARGIVLLGVLALGACAAILDVENVGYAPPSSDAGGDAPDAAGDAGDASAGDGAGACPAPPYAACPPGALARCATDAPCDINLTNDRNNCGECGRVCDTTCTGGVCFPTHIETRASDAGDTRPLWARDGLVVWLVGGQAYGEVLDPIGRQTSVYGVSGAPTLLADLAVDGMHAYVLTNYGINDNVVDDGTPLKTYTAPAQLGHEGRLAYDPDHLFYTEGVDGGSVVAVNRASGGVTVLADGQARPTNLLVLDGGVLFVNASEPDAATGALLTVSLALPGTTHQIKSALSPIEGFAAASDGALFYSFGGPDILQMTTARLTDRAFLGNLAEAHHLAADETYVLFDGRPNAAMPYGIYRARRCDGDLLPVASSTEPVTGLVLFERLVYWTAGGALYRTSF